MVMITKSRSAFATRTRLVASITWGRTCWMGSRELSSLLKKTGPEHSCQSIWVGACIAALTSARSKYRGTRPG